MAKKSTEERMQRMEDIYEVQQLMNRYEWLLFGGGDHFDEVCELFALKTHGVRAEMDSWGIWEGAEGIRRLFADFHRYASWDDELNSSRPGVMFEELNTTPVIEIAGDGKTAKGVWLCPGYMTAPLQGTLEAYWAWCKRAADFIKEDGEWKIWHYRVVGVFNCHYDTSWVAQEDSDEVQPPEHIPERFRADKPPTYHWVYKKTAVLRDIPAPPKPYETFDEKDAY